MKMQAVAAVRAVCRAMTGHDTSFITSVKQTTPASPAPSVLNMRQDERAKDAE
jgi:hypothetical protein